MKQQEQTTNGAPTAEKERIIIRRTVDGKAIDEANSDYNLEADSDNGSSTLQKIKSKVSGKKSEEPDRPKADKFIWGIYLSLLVISIIELYSASSSEVKADNIYEPLIRHGIFLALGLGIVMWFQKLHYGYFSRFASILAIGSLGLLIYSTFFGVTINGAQRAIRILGFTVQPPEIVKLTVIVWLATILGRNQRPGGVTNKGLVSVAVIVMVFSGVLWKNGLTNTILLMGVSVCMFLIGGIQFKKFLFVLVAYGAFAGLIYATKYSNDDSEFQAAANSEQVVSDRSGTHKGRVARYLAGVHPGDTIDDLNRQAMMARFSQANGGLTGKGLGNSRDASRLPLAFSDYIYSIIVEELGFIGGLFVLMLYLCLIFRAGRIAFHCSRAFPAFLIMGCAVLIVFQALMHMAIVTGVAPVSGQPLPLISKGGTSVIVMSAAIGIMLSVSRFAVTNNSKKELKAEAKQLSEDLQAENYSNANNEK